MKDLSVPVKGPHACSVRSGREEEITARAENAGLESLTWLLPRPTPDPGP